MVQLYTPPAAVVVEAIVVILSPMRADCTHCYSAVMTSSMGARHTMATPRCSRRCWRRTSSPHHRQAETFNLLMYDDVRATKAAELIDSTVNQGHYPQ
jgi:hypothetical protein